MLRNLAIRPRCHTLSKALDILKENCPHLAAFLKGLIHFVNNIYKLHYTGIPWKKTTLKLIKEINHIKKIKN